MKNRRVVTSCLGLAALAGLSVTIALAQPTKDATKPAPAGQPAKKDVTKQPADHATPPLPPGWTEADMQACIEAGTPGKHHEMLAKNEGTWTGNCKMWMAPGTEPMESPSSVTFKKVMDGRYVQCDWSGEMPGMGTFNGQGTYGYDNVAQKFQSSWIDNHSSGIMFGTGDLSADGKTLTWRYTYNCPITKKPTTMREIEHLTGPDTKKFEMFGIDPKSGKEYKMMEIELKRKG